MRGTAAKCTTASKRGTPGAGLQLGKIRPVEHRVIDLAGVRDVTDPVIHAFHAQRHLIKIDDAVALIPKVGNGMAARFAGPARKKYAHKNPPILDGER